MAGRHRQQVSRLRSPEVRARSSLRALFEGCGFAAQVGERFPGEMKRTGQQDRV